MAALLLHSAAVLGQIVSAEEVNPPTLSELSESVHATAELEAEWRAALEAIVSQLQARKIYRIVIIVYLP